MADWYCFEDKVKLEKADLTLNYMQLNQFFPGLKCPKCGVQYLMEEVVQTRVLSIENAVEEK